MPEQQLERIATALEKQNELFREWIDINRDSIQDVAAKRAEIFPHELEHMRLQVASLKRWEELGDKLDEVQKLTSKIAGEVTTPAEQPA